MILQKAIQPRVTNHMILQGVPRVGYYMGGERCPEDVPFPSCLRACLDYFGESLGYRLIPAHNTTWRLDDTFTLLMGVSGCAFRLSWKPGWHADNIEIRHMSDDPAAPFERAFAAVGYQPIMMGRDLSGEAGFDEQRCREAILRSLSEQGRPVIAFGVIGPPEACLITGYDEGGDVLVGWNYFQDFPEFSHGIETEPTGEFRLRNWFEATHGLLLFGEKRPTAPLKMMYREALHWALQVMRNPAVHGDPQQGGRHNGIAAYQAWADHLLRDEDFTEDIAGLRQRFMIHDDAVSTVAEGRWYAAKFMELLGSLEPAIEKDAAAEAAAAARCFEAEHDLMWQIWGLLGGNGCSDERAHRLASPTTRRSIVPIILQAMEKDRRAADHIEQALLHI
jgi:hypothetical protein